MDTKIKYDKKIIKKLILAFLMGFVLLMLGVILLHFEIYGTAVIMLFSLYIGFGVLVFSGCNLFAAFVYRRRLRKNGYEMPVDRREYHNRLVELPHENVDMDVSKKHMGSLILSVLFGVIFLFFFVWNIRLYIEWNYPHSDVAFMCGMLMLLNIYWLVSAIIYGRQINQEKYRDDVEIDPDRKERVSVEKGVFIAIIMLVVTAYANIMAGGALDYVLEAQASHDGALVSDICASIVSVYDEYKGTPEGEQMRDMLSEGFYLSELEVTDSPGFQEVAAMIGVSSFVELQDKFKTADGPARVYVWIGENGYLEVFFENPMKKVEVTIRQHQKLEP